LKTLPGAALLTAGLSVAACSGDRTPESLVEHGRYVVQIAGCNDCHTAGYALAEGKVDERAWLMGDSVGWHGPWGTTYPSNLRLYMAPLTEDQWVEAARSLKTRPPMPFFSLNIMTERDLRAIYQFTRSLGEPGRPAPAYLAPGTPAPLPVVEFRLPPPPAAAPGK
jgi:mono/diheme cytochrome c family protein